MSLPPARRGSSAAAAAIGLLPGELRGTEDNTIRPVNVPEADLVDLRIAATRWPDQETVTDRSQGAQLAKIQSLVRYWGTDYDWRKLEAKLNALKQFVTEIDGHDTQFAHVRFVMRTPCR